MKKLVSIALVAFVLAIGAFSSQAQASTPLSGWAWSSNIGWISFNSTNSGAGTGGTYRVDMATTSGPTTGTFSGYAWSSNIGWISFNPADLTGCTGATAAQANLSTGIVSGWIRAYRGLTSAGGWDGCIELAGTNHTSNVSANGAAGVTYHEASNSGIFKGYAWGGDVVGWLNFAPNVAAGTVVTVCSGAGCSGGGSAPVFTLVASNGSAIAGDGETLQVNLGSSNTATANLTWNLQGIDNCARQNISGTWSRVSGSNSIESETSGTGPINLIAGDAGTNIQFAINCDIPDNSFAGSHTETRRVTLQVNAYTPTALSCVQPTRSNTCSDPDGVIDYRYTNLPPGTSPLTNVQASCPTTPNPNYCAYVCQTGFHKSGNSCVSSTVTPR